MKDHGQNSCIFIFSEAGLNSLNEALDRRREKKNICRGSC